MSTGLLLACGRSSGISCWNHLAFGMETIFEILESRKENSDSCTPPQIPSKRKEYPGTVSPPALPDRWGRATRCGSWPCFHSWLVALAEDHDALQFPLLQSMEQAGPRGGQPTQSLRSPGWVLSLCSDMVDSYVSPQPCSIKPLPSSDSTEGHTFLQLTSSHTFCLLERHSIAFWGRNPVWSLRSCSLCPEIWTPRTLVTHRTPAPTTQCCSDWSIPQDPSFSLIA